MNCLRENSIGLSFRGAAGDEESRTALTTFRARFLAEFTLSAQSEILRFAQDDSEGLGMTVWYKKPNCLLPAAFLPLDGWSALDGKFDNESSSGRLVFLHPNDPLLFADDSADDGQAQSCASMLGGEIG